MGIDSGVNRASDRLSLFPDGVQSGADMRRCTVNPGGLCHVSAGKVAGMWQHCDIVAGDALIPEWHSSGYQKKGTCASFGLLRQAG